MIHNSGAIYHKTVYNRYLQWLHANTRLMLRPALTTVDIEDFPSSDEEPHVEDTYDAFTRVGTQPQRAPIQHYMVSTMQHF